MPEGIEKILAFALLLAIVTGAFFATTLKSGERYTEFFILNENGKAGDFPEKLTPGQNATIIAGIINREQTTASYLLQVNLDGEKILERTVELRDGEKTMQSVTFRPSRPGNQKLELNLFKDKSMPPYSLHLYLVVSP